MCMEGAWYSPSATNIGGVNRAITRASVDYVFVAIGINGDFYAMAFSTEPTGPVVLTKGEPEPVCCEA